MRGFDDRRRSSTLGVWLCLALVLVLGGLKVVALPETCRITLPAAISFAVTNVSASTVGSPSPTAVAFDTAVFLPSHALRISVKADSDFVPPSGTAIPASRVSWTTSNAVRGTGVNGTLSTTVYGQVYQSSANKTSGSVDVTWTLAAPGTPLRAGNHTLTMRWKLETF